MIPKSCIGTIRAILMGVVLAAMLPTGATAQKLTLKLGHLANEQNSWHKASLKFADELAARTKGRIVVEVYPNSSLGHEVDMVNGLQLGTLEMALFSDILQNWAPKATLMTIPYAYTSIEHMDSVVSGKIGKQIEAEIIERAQVRPIAYFARGPRNLTSNRPITHPNELRGIRMRVPSVPLQLSLWRALGAQPTPLAFAEVFTALQNGTVEAQENPLALIQSASFNEVQSFVNETEHVRNWIYLTIAEQVWQRLPKDDQQHVLDAAHVAQTYERELFLKDEDAIRTDLQAKGMTFVKVDQEAFAKMSREVVISGVDKSIRPMVEELFKQR